MIFFFASGGAKASSWSPVVEELLLLQDHEYLDQSFGKFTMVENDATVGRVPHVNRWEMVDILPG